MIVANEPLIGKAPAKGDSPLKKTDQSHHNQHSKTFVNKTRTPPGVGAGGDHYSKLNKKDFSPKSNTNQPQRQQQQQQQKNAESRPFAAAIQHPKPNEQNVRPQLKFPGSYPGPKQNNPPPPLQNRPPTHHQQPMFGAPGFGRPMRQPV